MRRRQHLEQSIDIAIGADVTEAEPQGATGGGLVEAHREQDVARLRHPRGARGAGRDLDPLGVEQHEERVSLASGEGDVDDSGQAVIIACERIAVDHGIGDESGDALDEPRAQPLDARGLLYILEPDDDEADSEDLSQLLNMVFSPDADSDIMLGTAAPAKHHYDDELIGGSSAAQSSDSDIINEDLGSLDDLLSQVVKQESASDEDEGDNE